MLRVAELARRMAQPTGIVSVTSRSFQKSCGYQNVSRWVFSGTHSLGSGAVSWLMLVAVAMGVEPLGERNGYARAQVGQRTARFRALKEAPSWIHAPPCYSPRADSVI